MNFVAIRDLHKVFEGRVASFQIADVDADVVADKNGKECINIYADIAATVHTDDGCDVSFNMRAFDEVNEIEDLEKHLVLSGMSNSSSTYVLIKSIIMLADLSL